MSEALYRRRPDGEGSKPATSVEDVMQKNALRALRGPGGLAGGHHPKAAAGSSGMADSDLIASMAKRLSLLEKDLRGKGKEVERLQSENEALKSKLHVAEEEIAARASSALAPPGTGPQPEDTPAVAHLRSENGRLRAQVAHAWQQVAEIKVFLNDYGLVWVGEEERRRSSTNGGAAHHEHISAGVGPRPPSGASAGALPPRPPGGEHAPSAQPPLRPDIRRRSYTGAGGAGVEPSSSSSGSKAPHSADSVSSAQHGSHSQHHHQDAAGLVSPPSALPFRMADLLAKVQELNQVAGDGCGQLVPRAGGHVLHTPEPVRLTVFKDGIQLHRAAPRPFRDPGVEQVLHDIMDGYFPGPLKAEFPEGVPIKVVDRARDSYKEALSPVNHPAVRGGAGGGGNVHTWNDLESGDHAAAPLSRDAFLSRLPQAVIKNGKVMDVRGGIGKVLGAPDSSSASGSGASSSPNAIVSVVSTPVDALLTISQRNHMGPVLPPPSREAGSSTRTPAAGTGAAAGVHQSARGEHGTAAVGGGGTASILVGKAPLPATAATPAQGPSIATLQIKSEDGQHTFIIKLQYDDTIGALRKYINTHRATAAQQYKGGAVAKSASAAAESYEIRTAFPPRKYEDLGETLRDAGLVPNATLFLRTSTPA